MTDTHETGKSVPACDGGNGGEPTKEEYRKVAMQGARSEVYRVKQDLDSHLTGINQKLGKEQNPTVRDLLDMQMKFVTSCEELLHTLEGLTAGEESAAVKELRGTYSVMNYALSIAKDLHAGEPSHRTEAREETRYVHYLVDELERHGGIVPYPERDPNETINPDTLDVAVEHAEARMNGESVDCESDQGGENND